MRNKRVFLPLLLAVLLLVCLCPVRAAASEVGEIYEKAVRKGSMIPWIRRRGHCSPKWGVEKGEPLPARRERNCCKRFHSCSGRNWQRL